jgi:ribonuclease E
LPTGERTQLPSAAAIKRAETLTRETFVHLGETKAEALAPGTPRRRALDAAVAESKAGLTTPSLEWRQEYSLLLGLERVLSDDEPKLADGTSLNPHQVDALSGTLTALLAQQASVAAEAAANPTAHPPAPTPTSASGSPSSANGSAPAAKAAAQPEASGATSLDDEDEDEDEDELDDEDHEPDEPEDLDEHEEPQDYSEDDTALDHDAMVDGEDPGADRRFWFEHATGAGKTVAAMGFVDASRTGGTLILTHRRNLVDQFIDEIKTRGYRDRLCPPLLIGEDAANGPVTVETYQWFVRNAGKISDAYTVVICDEAHTALGEKTSAQIRSWDKPIWIGMTATGALIARHVTDLFPTQTSRFDLAQAARRGVIAPLRCIRIPPGVGVRTIAKVPLRRGEVDVEFDQEMLAELLDQTPFNLAIADLYKTRFNGLPGVIYAAGVKHAYNVAEAFRSFDMKAMAVSGETPKRELARILADYEAGKVDVLVNAQLLAEGWNSPRATVCMHLAPTASKRIYQQRVGRVTRRHPGKEAGIVVDFVHPATKHDDPVVTLHSLLDRDVYRGGAIVVGPVRRGRGRRIRVERRVLPVTPDPDRRAEVFERELWRIAVENLDYAEQHVWAALAGAKVQPNGWRRAKAMLHFDRQGELRRRFLITALQRNRSAPLRLRALQEISASRDAEAFDSAIDIMGNWPRDERREGVKIMLLALAERRIGRRDQANAWLWRMAEYTRDVHEEYAAQRWPETKRLLGLLVNSSGSAHARNARRLVHATRTQDRRLSAALLAAALAHTPEAEEALRGARTRMARKPAALARELLRNFPKGKKSSSKRRRKAKTPAGGAPVAAAVGATATRDTVDVELETTVGGLAPDDTEFDDDDVELDHDDLIDDADDPYDDDEADIAAAAEADKVADAAGDDAQRKRANSPVLSAAAGIAALVEAAEAAETGRPGTAAKRTARRRRRRSGSSANAATQSRPGAETTPETQGAPEAPDTTEVPSAPQAASAPDAPEIPSAPEVVIEPEVPIAPETSHLTEGAVAAGTAAAEAATAAAPVAEPDTDADSAVEPAKKPAPRKRATTARSSTAVKPTTTTRRRTVATPAEAPAAAEAASEPAAEPKKPTPRKRASTAKSATAQPAAGAKPAAPRRRAAAKPAEAPAEEPTAEAEPATSADPETVSAQTVSAPAAEPKQPTPRKRATATKSPAAAKPATPRRKPAAKPKAEADTSADPPELPGVNGDSPPEELDAAEAA